MLVDGFVDQINDYRQNFYVPSQDICVDESMSRYLSGYRWMLVDGFVDRINNYRQNFYVPSQDICVDEYDSHL